MPHGVTVIFINGVRSQSINPLVISSALALAGASGHSEGRRALRHHRRQSEGGGAGSCPHSGAGGPPEHLTVLHRRGEGRPQP